MSKKGGGAKKSLNVSPKNINSVSTMDNALGIKDFIKF